LQRFPERFEICSRAVVLDVHFEQGLSESLSFTPLGADRYRAEESSIASESINLGDVIEAEPGPDNGIRFVRVIEKSPLTTLRWLIPQDAAESKGLGQFLVKVDAAGGRWERALGGFLFLHLPHACGFDVDREFKHYTGCSSPRNERGQLDNV
jgi:hypothetical protein